MPDRNKMDEKQIEKRVKLAAELSDRFRLEECGCCDCYHRPGWHGDCRNDDERFSDHNALARRYWKRMIDHAPEIWLRRGIIKVKWEYIGEGMTGDYNEDSEFDMPVWRFYISILSGSQADGTEIWDDVENGSYCTVLALDTFHSYLDKFARIIMDRVEDNINNDKSVKKICQELSWIDKSWLE